jgi:hypothetical protein
MIQNRSAAFASLRPIAPRPHLAGAVGSRSAGGFLTTGSVISRLMMSLLLAGPALADSDPGIPRSPRPEDARVYIISPADGETVSSPVTVQFGLGGMGVAPAGVEKPATGHHHLIVDAPLPPADLPIPKDDHYRHFGVGQTEVVLELEPGDHTLQLVLGDHIHVPHDPPVVSEKITITVVD